MVKRARSRLVLVLERRGGGGLARCRKRQKHLESTGRRALLVWLLWETLEEKTFGH